MKRLIFWSARAVLGTLNKLPAPAARIGKRLLVAVAVAVFSPVIAWTFAPLAGRMLELGARMLWLKALELWLRMLNLWLRARTLRLAAQTLWLGIGMAWAIMGRSGRRALLAGLVSALAIHWSLGEPRQRCSILSEEQRMAQYPYQNNAAPRTSGFVDATQHGELHSRQLELAICRQLGKNVVRPASRFGAEPLTSLTSSGQPTR